MNIAGDFLRFLENGECKQFSINNSFIDVAEIMGSDTYNPDFPDYRFDDDFEVYAIDNEIIRIRFQFNMDSRRTKSYAEWHDWIIGRKYNFVSEILNASNIIHIIHLFSDGYAIEMSNYPAYLTFDNEGKIDSVQYDRRGFKPLVPPIRSIAVG